MNTVSCPVPVTHPDHRDTTQACATIAVAPTHLCGLHLRALQADIADIARVTALDNTWHHDLLTATGTTTGGRSVPDSRPPLRVAAIITGRSRDTILGWAADIIRTSRTLTLAEAGTLLRRNIDTLARHPALADTPSLATELRDAAADCRDAIPDDRWNDDEQDRHTAPLGRCPMPDPRGQQERCGGPLRWREAAVWTSEGHDLVAIEVECARCADVWGINDLPHILRVVQPTRRFPVPRDWITRTYSIRADQLRQWIRRGHVRTYANEDVDLFDVLARLTDTQAAG